MIEVMCAYCEREQEVEGDEDTYVPSVDDDEAWEELAESHAADCEWIKTRAHRQ